MEASSSDTKINTLKKPLLIIKRSSLFKHNGELPLLMRTTKRAITDVGSAVQIDNTNSKRTCLASDVQSTPEVSLKITTTAANTSNATDKPRGNTCATSSLQKNTALEKTEKTNDVPKKRFRKNQPMNMIYTPKEEFMNTNKIKFNEIPKTKCEKHGALPVHQKESLLQVGDVFKSIEEFTDYVAEHAKHWFFYYLRCKSCNMKASATYNSKKPTLCYYQCRFNKKHYKSRSKGIRKIRKSTVECPASVSLRCDPGTDLFKVTDVCHHHSHELSAELFSQQPHGYRLPQHLKDEIRDLARLNLDSGLVQQYVESKIPGMNIRKSIYNQFFKVRRQGAKDNMSRERIKEMLEKIKYIKANFNPTLKGPIPKAVKEPKKGLNPKALKNPRKSSSQEVLNEPRGTTPKKVRQSYNDVFITKDKNKRLGNKSSDQELIQSDTEQQTPACETQLNPWQEASSNDTDSDDENFKYETEDEISLEDSTNDTADDFDDSNEPLIIENPKTGISNKIIRIVNPTAGDIRMPIVEPETAISDERMPIVKPELVHSNQQSVESTNKSVNAYKIGDVTVETVETVDDSGIAAVVLHRIKSNMDLTERHLINELPKVSTTEPYPEPVKNCTKNIEPKEAPVALISDNIYSDAYKHKYLIKAQARTESRCQSRHSELPEYQADGLIKIGDTFSSMEEFNRYSAAHALKWFFYYFVHDSRNVKTSAKYHSNRTTWYSFCCRFNKGGYKSQSTGARKIKRKSIQCPATVSMRCKPGEDVFTVTYVCHHHSHELTPEIFSQEPHGHRLLPEWKEEIRELAWFKLDGRLIRQYFNAKTGLDLKLTIKNVICKLNRERQKMKVPPEKERQILEKIEDIKQKFVIPKRAPPRSKNKNSLKNIPHDTIEPSESDDEGNKSRVEARLNNILYDQELIQSVKELQETTGCEIRINPWGEVNVIENGITNLQAGLIEDPGCNDLQHANDDKDDVDNSQIEIDQELYSMDDNVRYIIPSDQDEPTIFGVIDRVDNTSDVCDENVVYIQQIQSIEDGINILEVDNTEALCGEKVQYEVPSSDDESYYIGEADNTTQPDENISIDECTEEENTELPKRYQEAAFEYSDNENEYQTMYQHTNDEYSNIENEMKLNETSEHLNDAQRYRKETYKSRNIGVQADSQIIELERDSAKIKKLESIHLSKDFGKITHSFSTRGRPKTVLEEGIINRFNIEFYISHSGITTCLENLAVSMGLSVLDLLKKLYQGEAVFKMSLGRSGKQDRKTVQLAYVPLTTAFPFEKFKYINGLQEYKTMCSKYSDVAIKLETAVENMSNELNATKIKLENAELQNQHILDNLESHQNLLNPQAQTEQLLKKFQNDLEEAQAVENATSMKHKIDLQLAKEQNEILLKKIKDLENLQKTSRLKDAEILKQLLEPTFGRHKINRARTENKFLRERIKELEEKSPADIRLNEKIKMLEQTVEISDADTRHHKEKIRKLEELYLSDSQSLLRKIKMLEYELGTLRTESSYMKKTENPSSYIIRYTELENKRLRKEMNDLEELKSSDNKKLNEKIKRLNDAVSALTKRLNEQKQKK